MTVSEAIKILKRDLQIQKDNKALPDGIESLEIAIKSLEELEQCRAIGTIEEFKALKEKSVAKNPRFYAHNYYCTECGNLVGNNEYEWQRFLYCDKCGQKIDWQGDEKIWLI